VAAVLQPCTHGIVQAGRASLRGRRLVTPACNHPHRAAHQTCPAHPLMALSADRYLTDCERRLGHTPAAAAHKTDRQDVLCQHSSDAEWLRRRQSTHSSTPTQPHETCMCGRDACRGVESPACAVRSSDQQPQLAGAPKSFTGDHPLLPGTLGTGPRLDGRPAEPHMAAQQAPVSAVLRQHDGGLCWLQQGGCHLQGTDHQQGDQPPASARACGSTGRQQAAVEKNVTCCSIDNCHAATTVPVMRCVQRWRQDT
jgi:hypothetical protein